MKVILSRKGFDSAAGGYPSPILPDGRLISLPVPDKQDSVHYSDLKLESNRTYQDLMNELGIKTKILTCHLDPDIRKEVINRESGWRPVFGQSGAAQTHLNKNNVEEDDIFLFFGWFKEYPNGNDKHIIFGYLQVGGKINVNPSFRPPKWMALHPHMLDERRENPRNTVYVARETLSWNNNIPGAGVFRFNNSLVLTKKGQTRSHWELPSCFRDAKISYHNASCWKHDYFESRGRGQEFVIDNKDVEKWAKNIIEANIQSD
jgi:hypothetical protein